MTGFEVLRSIAAKDDAPFRVAMPERLFPYRFYDEITARLMISAEMAVPGICDDLGAIRTDFIITQDNIVRALAARIAKVDES